MPLGHFGSSCGDVSFEFLPFGHFCRSGKAAKGGGVRGASNCSKAAVRMKYLSPSSETPLQGDAVGQDAAAGVSDYTEKG